MIVVGIDEVGRGCWAGPLVAGAVILSRKPKGLKDSKQLIKPERERLSAIIKERALAFGIGWTDTETIDRIGITAAVKLAMERALEQIAIMYDEIIIDGNHNFMAENPKARVVIKADTSVPAVSAASIIAKVARDNYMAEIAAEYPGYGFEQHVGYGTLMHRERLKLHGVSSLHRQSFKPIRALLQ